MTKIEKYFKDEITPNEAYDLLFEFVGYISLRLHNRLDELYDFFAYDHLFQFIKERRRI